MNWWHSWTSTGKLRLITFAILRTIALDGRSRGSGFGEGHQEYSRKATSQCTESLERATEAETLKQNEFKKAQDELAQGAEKMKQAESAAKKAKKTLEKATSGGGAEEVEPSAELVEASQAAEAELLKCQETLAELQAAADECKKMLEAATDEKKRATKALVEADSFEVASSKGTLASVERLGKIATLRFLLSCASTPAKEDGAFGTTLMQ